MLKARDRNKKKTWPFHHRETYDKIKILVLSPRAILDLRAIDTYFVHTKCTTDLVFCAADNFERQNQQAETLICLTFVLCFNFTNCCRMSGDFVCGLFAGSRIRLVSVPAHLLSPVPLSLEFHCSPFVSFLVVELFLHRFVSLRSVKVFENLVQAYF